MPPSPSKLDTEQIDEAYWAALAEGRLVLQVCVCGHRWAPPRGNCSRCLRADWKWETATGGGRLKTWVVYHIALHESFRDRLPYNVAIVELDEGPSVITNILGSNDALQAEARVRFVASREGERTVARFELIP